MRMMSGNNDSTWRIRLVESHSRIVDPKLRIRVRDRSSHIVAEMLNALESDKSNTPDSPWLILTLKEKLGELRAIVWPRPGADVEGILERAQAAAKQTCDIWAEAGTIRDDGGLLCVRCDDHAKDSYMAGTGPVEVSSDES